MGPDLSLDPRADFEQKLTSVLSDQDFDKDQWQLLLQRVHYYPVDVTSVESYEPLVAALAGREDHVRVFYLSVAPSLFTHITNGVHQAGLSGREPTPDPAPG